MATRKETSDRRLVRTRIRAPMSRRARSGSDADTEPTSPETSELAPASAALRGSPTSPTTAAVTSMEFPAAPTATPIPTTPTPAAVLSPTPVPQPSLNSPENPTHLPGPKQIPGGDPEDLAAAPGLVPAGDSRSLRRDDEFALVYRVGTNVICRSGSVGKRGQWRVIEYPTSAAAGNYYARECSRFVAEGFSDYRE